MTWRAAAAALVCAVAGMAGSASAQTQPPKIAVVSLIGDAITVDEYVGQTGTMFDPLTHQTFAVSSPLFDQTALLSAQDALKKLYPVAQVATLAPPRAGSDSDPAKLLATGKVDPANPLIAALRKEGYAQLIVIEKLRAPARMQLRSESVGRGHVKGLGFYVDRKYEIRKIDTGDTTTGFIAPYAYIKLSLVDMDKLAVLRDSPIIQDRVEADFNFRAGVSPWDALTPAQKTKMLRELVTRGVANALPVLMEAKQP